jgi:hypothetical protein
LNSKYYAFETWLAFVIKPRVVASISFIFIKKMIVWVVKQYLKDLKVKLFPNFGNAPSVKKIENLIKPTNFMINSLNTPILVSYRCLRINMNVTPPSSSTTISNKQQTTWLEII